MQLADYLNAYSVEDLRELAARRGVMLSPSALHGRQTLVRALTASLTRYDSIYPVVAQLNEAELGVLRWALTAGKRAGLSRFCAETGAEPAAVRPVLDSLRLWGLLFPEGNWDHIVVPPSAQMAVHYMGPAPRAGQAVSLSLAPPALDAGPADACKPRPGSFSRDQSELLARVARSRLKLTQAGRMNRRDLKAMDPVFGIATSGYSTFLYMLCGTTGLLRTSEAGVIEVREDVDGFLGQPEAARVRITVSAWMIMRGYPENTARDPADEEYVPQSLASQRVRVVQALKEIEPGKAVTLASLVRRMLWGAPLAFAGWDGSRDAHLATRRMCRSLYWTGAAAVDDPENPGRMAITPLGAGALRDQEAGPLVPEEAQFFLQPNAEIFAPPNLSPRTLFHLRRITGEKKGGPAGMYPLTPDSLRRGLDAGLTAAEIITFLERFSRTGLPPNVRSLVETAGRQHGRIRLVPTTFVLVTDEPGLLKELRQIKTVGDLVGGTLTERAAEVDAGRVADLVKRLRAKGYAPLNMAEVGEGPPLAQDPDTIPHLPQVPGDPFPITIVEDESDDVPDGDFAPGKMATHPDDVWDLLAQALELGQVVEIEYHNPEKREVMVRKICPLDLDDLTVTGFCRLRNDDRIFNVKRIRWARLTGETFEV